MRKEVVEMIQTQSPYIQDRLDIRHRLENMKETTDKLEEHMDKVVDDLHATRGGIERIEAILDERSRRRDG